MSRQDRLKELMTIPNIGPKCSEYLYEIGIRSVADLKGRDPEDLYNMFCIKRGRKIDRCLLYVFRCAVYFAGHKSHDPRKLKWNYWKDKK